MSVNIQFLFRQCFIPLHLLSETRQNQKKKKKVLVFIFFSYFYFFSSLHLYLYPFFCIFPPSFLAYSSHRSSSLIFHFQHINRVIALTLVSKLRECIRSAPLALSACFFVAYPLEPATNEWQISLDFFFTLPNLKNELQLVFR